MRKNWSEFRETCLNSSSDLVSIASREEEMFLTELFIKAAGSAGKKQAWIGLVFNDSAWSDGSPVGYIGTVSPPVDVPSPSCYSLVMDGEWLVKPCANEKRYAICKLRKG